MADTISSINLSGTDWQNLNTLFGITVGTAIEIQNQSSTSILLAISPTKPALDFKGVVVPPIPSELATVDAGESSVWAIGSGPVNVQVA